MELDPTLYSPYHDAPARSPSPPPSAPLPPVTLPSAPRPSVSPSVSRVFQKKTQDAAPTMGGGLDLSVPPSPLGGRQNSLAPQAQDDARDTASARDNIINLVSAGQRSLGSDGGPSSTPSLAMFMGGGAQRRTHRVGTGMTEIEKEETERLEREMAATRAKWGDQGTQADPEPARAGLSLADLMKGATKNASSTSAVAAKVAPGFPSKPEPDSPSSSPAGPQAPTLAEPAVIEAKAISRAPPQPQSEPPAPHKSASTPLPGTAVANGSPPTSSGESQAAMLPRSASFGLKGDTLTKLQSSNIVADRLKWTQTMQQTDPATDPSSPPSAPPSPEKRRSVLERWGRDEPNAATPASPSRQRTFGLDGGAPREDLRKSPDSLEADSKQGASGYTKPIWSAAPIGVKEPSKPRSPPVTDAEPTPSEPRPTRGVALPGLSSGVPPSIPPSAPSSGPVSRADSVEAPASPVRTRMTSSRALDEPPASPGRPSVRAAAMRWGQAAAQSAAEKSEALQALKASYGVKVAPTGPSRGATVPLPSSQQQQAKTNDVAVPLKSKSVEVATPEPRPKENKAEASVASHVALPEPQGKSAPKAATAPPLAKSSNPAAPVAQARPRAPAVVERTVADDIVAAILAPRHVAHLPPGETLSLDVFHLNSPSDDPYPIDHNHMLFSTEIVGVVYRAVADAANGDDVFTRTWVWFGADADLTRRTEERIARLAEKTGTKPVEVEAGEEGAELSEAFAGQLTVCRGRREDFDHLAQRMFSVQSHDGAVFVEETDLSVRSLCSGYATVFSSLGEVYAWLGEGSTDLERHAACEFAESLADGRTVTVLAEGEETALFWHQLAADGTEYSSAHYWRYRALHPQSVSLVRFSPDPSTRYTLLPSLEISPAHVSLLDGGFAEHWIIVPESVLPDKKADVELALEAAQKLAAKWEERGFGARTPFHVLLIPSLIPRDLPFLSRAIDWAALNDGAEPRKMRVYTAQEARDELL